MDNTKRIMLYNNKKIVLYSDEFPIDVWENYCDILEVPFSSNSITLYINNIEYETDMEEDIEEDNSLPTEFFLDGDDLELDDEVLRTKELEEKISNYLSYTYFYCVNSFKYDIIYKNDEFYAIKVREVNWDLTE